MRNEAAKNLTVNEAILNGKAIDLIIREIRPLNEALTFIERNKSESLLTKHGLQRKFQDLLNEAVRKQSSHRTFSELYDNFINLCYKFDVMPYNPFINVFGGEKCKEVELHLLSIQYYK